MSLREVNCLFKIFLGTSPISQWVSRCSELPLSQDQKEQLDNVIDKLYSDIDNVSGNFLNTEGVGLYHLQSSCNHSCIPNAEPTFLDNSSKLSLVALEDIRAGDEICINYMDECTSQRSRHSRQKILSQYYLFQCKCPKCEEQAEDPDETSEEEEEEDNIEEEDMSE